MKLVLSRSVFSTGMTMTRWMTYLTTVSRPMSPRVMSTFNPSLPGLGIVSAPLYFSSTSYNGNNNNKRHHIGDRGNRDHSRPETISLYGTASDYHSDRLSMLLLGRSFPIPIGGSSCFSSTALQARRWRSSASSDKSEEWEVPDTIPIPEEKLDFHYVRSSGPGGQNVNKVNSYVQLRFHIPSALWIPEEVRKRLQEQQKNRISKDGILLVGSQVHRSQADNKRDAVRKLEEMIRAAWERPKERQQYVGISEKSKKERMEFKKRRKALKEQRRVNWNDHDF